MAHLRGRHGKLGADAGAGGGENGGARGHGEVLTAPGTIEDTLKHRHDQRQALAGIGRV